MKKILMTAAVILALILAGCGEVASPEKAGDDPDAAISGDTTISDVNGTSSPEGSDTSTNETTGGGAVNVDPASYDCVLDNGVTITLGSKAADTIKALTDKLGKELDFMEAASCVHPGNDKVYTYEGFTVTTSPDAAGNEFVAEVSFLSDAVGFENGIMIGSTEEDVTTAFGEDFEEKFGVRKYDLDGVTLTITFTSGAVSAMSISTAA